MRLDNNKGANISEHKAGGPGTRWNPRGPLHDFVGE